MDDRFDQPHEMTKQTKGKQRSTYSSCFLFCQIKERQAGQSAKNAKRDAEQLHDGSITPTAALLDQEPSKKRNTVYQQKQKTRTTKRSIIVLVFVLLARLQATFLWNHSEAV
jgi:hypothetical protein